MNKKKTTKIIDSHCHLDFPKFNTDRAEVLQRAQKNSITKLVNSGTDYTTNNTTLKLSKEYKHIYPTLGLSPNRISTINKENLNKILTQITEHLEEIVGIGEIGLDYFHCRDNKTREKQQAIFQEILDLSTTIDKPIILHARHAEDIALGMVKHHNKVVFHCYSGNPEILKQITNCGFYTSLSTLVCFSEHHQQLAEEVPLTHLLVETDSPFLSPRKGRNEPAFITDLIEKISEIKHTDCEDIANKTTKNAEKIFDI